MTTYLGIHDVDLIELVSSNPINGNSKTFRIISRDYSGNAYSTEITVYGFTKALDALPKAHDYRECVTDTEAV